MPISSLHKKKRVKNAVVFLTVLGIMGLIFLVTMVRLGGL